MSGYADSKREVAPSVGTSAEMPVEASCVDLRSDAAETARQLEKLLQLRAGEYAALSNVFVRESTPAAIREIIDSAMAALAPGGADAGVDMDVSAAADSGAGAEAGSDMDADARELARSMAALDAAPFDDLCTKTRTEYVRMFIGLRTIAVPAHESMYRGDACRMMTPVTFSVRNAYAAAGFQVTKKNAEPDDHMGIELEFMATLCARCASAASRGEHASVLRDLDALRAFAEEHLLQWAPQFAEATEREDESGYYGPWARYLVSFLEKDKELQAECDRLAHALS